MKLQWKKRDPGSYKGDNGRILVIGGSEDYVGAPALVSLGAMHAGCDWVTIAAPEDVAWTINSYSPDYMTKKLDGQFVNKTHIKQLLQEEHKYDVVVIGNGIGHHKQTAAFVHEFMRHVDKPVVIDADALHMIKMKECKNTLFTPHISECTALLHHCRLPSLQQMKKNKKAPFLRSNALLLKGATDYIFSSDSMLKNHTGHPGMTVSGTGDVLAGVAATFIAQGDTLIDAAYKAAYVNGKAGQLAGKKYGYGYTAIDVAHHIPLAIKQISGWK